MKFINDEVKLKNDKEEIINICASAYKRSVFALKEFFIKLGIDPNVFNHLFNIEISIDNSMQTNSERLAAFFTQEDVTFEPKIFICASYVDDLISYCKKKYKMNKRVKNEIITELSRTIIHEMIHANRNIILNNTKDISSSVIINDIEYLNELDELNKKFDYLVINGEADFSKNEIVISIEFHNDYLLVTTYNQEEEWFTKYKIKRNSIKYDSLEKIKRFLENIFNINKYHHVFEPYKIIKSFDEPTLSLLCSDYDLSNYKANNRLMLDRILLHDNISKQIGLEEEITEAIAGIIITSRNDMDFDIDDICNRLINSPRELDDIKRIYKIIKYYKNDFIYWFITSCYMDEYHNYIEEKFGDDYNTLLSSFYRIYSNYEKRLNMDRELSNIDEIIEKRLIKN